MATNLRRFYTDEQLNHNNQEIALNEAEASHIYKTLRMSAGDKLEVFNGSHKATAELVHVSRSSVRVRLIDSPQESTAPNKQLILLQSIIKPSNFELILQKATELGAAKIVPIISEYSQVKPDIYTKKYARWEKIVIEACKQAERTDLLELDQPTKFADMITQLSEYTGKFAAIVPREGRNPKYFSNYRNQIESNSEVYIFIGPEGGFSPAEQSVLIDNNFQAVLLSQHVLRAETAAITALSQLQEYQS